MSLTTDLSSADPRRGDNTISPWTELKESPANGIPLGDIEVWTHMILDDQYTKFLPFQPKFTLVTPLVIGTFGS